MLHVQCFTFNSFAENTYVVYDDTKKCAIVDPGCYAQHEQAALSNFITEKALQVTHLINTHAHIDHIVGNWYVQTTYHVPLALHAQEVHMLQVAIQYAPVYGFAAYMPIKAEKLLTTADDIQLGKHRFSVLHVPGHSPGHIALYNPENKCCFSGDVLFQGTIGTTDLPYGDQKLLLQSIQQELCKLGDDVIIYPGHGPTTTIGKEKRDNIFLKANVPRLP